jgi:ABC-type oligopeptide transport system substrate-binding subunit
VLRLGLERIKSFDPAQVVPTSQSQLIAADLLFDGLTTVPSGAATAQPALAADWKASDDQRTWRFTLRDDARFSNGRAISADDVKYSLERVAKQYESTVPAIRLEGIVGYQDFVSGTTPTIAGIKAVDARTVQIDLALPFAMLPELLASPSYGVVPREAVEAASPTFSTAPVGSGPFAYTGTDGDVVKLVRAGESSALVDGVELHEYDDLGKSYDDFVADKLDWSLVPNAKADDAASRFGTDSFRPFQAELFYAFNLNDPTFGDVRFRQAIIKAVDRAALVKAVYPGIADPLNGIVPDDVAAHVVDPCGPTCAFDQAAARDLVNQVFPGGPVPTVSIDYFEGQQEEAVAGVLETSLTAVGIPVAKRPKPADQYDQFVVTGQAQLFRLGAIGIYPDADAYLGPFIKGSRDNAIGFASDAFDGLMQQIRQTVDPAARVKLEQQAEQLFMSLAPIVPIAQFRTTAVVAKRVHDLTVSVGGTFAGSDVSLD